MDLMLLRLFQQQVVNQCRMTMHGVELVNVGLQQNDQDTLWVGVQILLTGAANISKALWGMRGRYSAEREPLRRSLGVDEASSLRDLGMRNHFEHYDERLDRWWRESLNHIHLDYMIGSPGQISGLKDSDCFRVYDPSSKEVVFWGERFNIQAIASATEALLRRALAEVSKPHWEVDTNDGQ